MRQSELSNPNVMLCLLWVLQVSESIIGMWWRWLWIVMMMMMMMMMMMKNSRSHTMHHPFSSSSKVIIHCHPYNQFLSYHYLDNLSSFPFVVVVVGRKGVPVTYSLS